MHLDESNKQKVAAWIAEGLKLSEIQSRLAAELGVTMTYMEIRFLVDDLKLTPKDQPAPQPVQQLSTPGAPAGASRPDSPLPEAGAEDDALDPTPGGLPGKISVSVDHVARPGALVSGSVTFSDGNTAAWYLDQAGRLGIVPKVAGYRPPPQDVQTFQMELQNELAKLGF